MRDLPLITSIYRHLAAMLHALVERLFVPPAQQQRRTEEAPPEPPPADGPLADHPAHWVEKIRQTAPHLLEEGFTEYTVDPSKWSGEDVPQQRQKSTRPRPHRGPASHQEQAPQRSPTRPPAPRGEHTARPGRPPRESAPAGRPTRRQTPSRSAAAERRTSPSRIPRPSSPSRSNAREPAGSPTQPTGEAPSAGQNTASPAADSSGPRTPEPAEQNRPPGEGLPPEQTTHAGPERQPGRETRPGSRPPAGETDRSPTAPPDGTNRTKTETENAPPSEVRDGEHGRESRAMPESQGRRQPQPERVEQPEPPRATQQRPHTARPVRTPTPGDQTDRAPVRRNTPPGQRRRQTARPLPWPQLLPHDEAAEQGHSRPGREDLASYPSHEQPADRGDAAWSPETEGPARPDSRPPTPRRRINADRTSGRDVGGGHRPPAGGSETPARETGAQTFSAAATPGPSRGGSSGCWIPLPDIEGEEPPGPDRMRRSWARARRLELEQEGQKWNE